MQGLWEVHVEDQQVSWAVQREESRHEERNKGERQSKSLVL